MRATAACRGDITPGRTALGAARKSYFNLLIIKEKNAITGPILKVVFDTPLRSSFDYLPPAGAPVPQPGGRVRALL